MLFASSNGGDCPTCGVPHGACGQSPAVTPVDIPEEAPTMVGPTRKYHAVVNGTKTILKLSERDASTMPGVLGPVDDAPARTGGATTSGAAAPRKTRRAPANKARRAPSNKTQE